MKLDNFEKMKHSIFDADLVLVGLGEEWVLSGNAIVSDLEHKDTVLKVLLETAYEQETFQKLVPLLEGYYYTHYMPKEFALAYDNLKNLIENKNYFVVSLTIDPYLQKCGFREERIVNPCGTIQKMQCDVGCNEHLVSSDTLFAQIENVIRCFDYDDHIGQKETEDLLQKCASILETFRCETCGNQLDFNTLSVKKYREEGYLAQWQIYMKWLQGTLNKKLCVIEAGVGMKFPSVIRWPFEKTVFYNQKAKMFRIHEKYYQVNEEIASRSFSCNKNAVQFFAEKKVEVSL